MQELAVDFKANNFTSYDDNYTPKYTLKSTDYLNMVKNLNFDKCVNQLKPIYAKLGITADNGYKLYLPSFSIAAGILPSVFSKDYQPSTILPIPDSGFNHMNKNYDTTVELRDIFQYVKTNITRLGHKDPSPVSIGYLPSRDIEQNKKHTNNNPIWKAPIFVHSESMFKPEIYPYNGYYYRYGIYRIESDEMKKIKIILDYIEKTYLK